MSVGVESTVPPVPDTVDEVVTDPDWQARCDQVRAALRRTTLPVYGGSVRVPVGWGTCAVCTTPAHCSAEQWCSKGDVEYSAGAAVLRAKLDAADVDEPAEVDDDRPVELDADRQGVAR